MRAHRLLGLVISMVLGCAAPGALEGEGFELGFGDAKTDEGSSRFDGELGECASPLMRAIHQGAIEVAGRGNVPPELFATHRNRADAPMLRDGPEIFPAMSDLIAGARSEVVFETYVWERDSQAAHAILDGLVRLQERLRDEGASRPITARLLLDTSSVAVAGRRASDLMPEVAASFEALDLDPAYVRYELIAFSRTTFGNQHAKLLVVDGRAAILTGANPEIVHDAGEPWHDSGYRVDGDIAVAFLGDFDDGRRRGRVWTCGSRGGDDCLRDPEPITYRVLSAEVDGCHPMLAIGRAPNANPFNNRLDNTQDQAYLAAFASAQSLIRVQTPNINDDAFQDAILDAIERGVTVELVTGRRFNEGGESIPSQGGGNEDNVASLYEALADRGVADACERLRMRWYSYDGVTPVVGNGPRASHTKYASFDHQVAIVGSTNMDTQSWNNAREADVVVDDSEVVRAWDERLFEADFARGIVPEECGGPPAPAE